MSQLSPEQIDAIRGKIQVLQSEIADREEAITNMKRTLTEALPVGVNPVGDYNISVYQNRQFQAKLAESVLPHDRWLAISKPSRITTSAMAQKVLTEEEFALCQKVSDDLSVKIEERRD